jgi:hypothetical protein
MFVFRKLMQINGSRRPQRQRREDAQTKGKAAV